MKKTFLIIILSILMQPDAAAQTKTGVENYNFLNTGEGYVWMPVVHHQGRKGFYAEMRYNYEANRTASLYAGKSFGKEGTITWCFTPMAGIVFGNYTGFSAAVNTSLEYKKFFLSGQTQYTLNNRTRQDHFFFNWSELGYQPVKWFYAGISTQFTQLYKSTFAAEYGLMLGIVIKKITIPLYVFNQLGGKKNYIIGINAEW